MIDGGLRKTFREHLPRMHWQSVETGGTGLGVPDSNYCCEGIEGWVEFKQTHGWAVTLRPEQVGWLLRRTRSGGRTFVAVRRKAAAGARRGEAVDELWLFPGRLAGVARSMGLRGIESNPDVRRLAGGPACWNWSTVEWMLLHSLVI